MRVVRIRHCALFDCVVIFAATGNNDFVILSILNLVLNFFLLVKETAQIVEVLEIRYHWLHLVLVEVLQVLLAELTVIIAEVFCRTTERLLRCASCAIPEVPSVTLSEKLDAQAILLRQLLGLLKRVEADDSLLQPLGITCSARSSLD